MYTFNPTSAEASLLAQIAQRESGGNYNATISQASCTQLGYTVCTASGAYQIINATWQEATAATGVPVYPTAAAAPPQVQDINALWILRNRGTAPWASSGPYDTTGASSSTDGSSSGAIVDLTGSAAGSSTSDLLTELGISDALASAGIDLTNSQDALALGVGVLAAVAITAWAVS